MTMENKTVRDVLIDLVKNALRDFTDWRNGLLDRQGVENSKEILIGKAESSLKRIIIGEFVEKLKGELYVYNNHMPEVIDEERIDRIYREFVGEEE